MILKKKELRFIVKSIKKETKIRFCFLFLIVLLVAISEYYTVGISGVFAKELLGLNIQSNTNAVNPIRTSLSFLIFIIVTNLGRTLVTYYSIRLSYISSSQICQKVYKNYLNQDYINFLHTNSSRLISAVSTKADLLTTNLILLYRIYT